jgi:hypothetical protein
MNSKWFAKACAGIMLLSFGTYAEAHSLHIALQSQTTPVSWPVPDQIRDQKTLPLVVLTRQWPLVDDPPEALFPPDAIPVLLRLQFKDPYQAVENLDLDRLNGLVKTHRNISHMAIDVIAKADERDQLIYLIKKISVQARGANSDIQIAVELNDEGDAIDFFNLIQDLATNPDVAPYFDAFLCRKISEKVRQMVFEKGPRFVFWKWIDTVRKENGNPPDPQAILARIIEDQEFEKQGTVLLLIESENIGNRYSLFSRFSAYLENEMFRNSQQIMVNAEDGSSFQLPFFQKTKDLSYILFLGTTDKVRLKLSLEKGEYEEARIENLVTGERFVLKIRKHAKALLIKRQKAFLAIELLQKSEDSIETRANVEVKGRFKLTAEEIVARVRAWDALQNSKLHSYIATMTVSLRLHVANMNETFDLTTRGPMFAERGKPYDWAWREFYVNGVRWKGKVAPKIPLLQPEKVNILPFAIDLAEDYQYVLSGETTFAGHSVYVIDFRPKKKIESESSYQGRIYIDAATFSRLYEHALQLNLKGDVLSNIETQYIEPVPGADNVWLPLKVEGEQVFSTGGRATNVERKVTLTEVVVNPPDLESRRAEAFQSRMQITRDTDKGLRYLVKNEKSGQRIVEWEVKKSQLAGVLGTFYDSSLTLPLPILGVSYMNFNLGGKGKQVNFLFGGALLTANYSDPSFLGTRADLGADIFLIALPSKNEAYRNGTPIAEEKIRSLPARLQINFGYPLNPYLKFTTSFFANYNHYSRSPDTAEDFFLPESGFTYGAHALLNLDINGFNLSLQGTYARRSRWDFWGRNGSSEYTPDEKSYVRWRMLFNKDFFFSKFRRLHLSGGYFDGIRLDRFSAFEFGFFSELKLHGFKTGAVRADRAWTFNLSYGYSVGEAFRLEGYYDSALVTNRHTGYANTYFSGTGISGTTNIPGLNTILRFDVGLPVIGNGVRGFAIYLILLKMF